MAYSVNRTPLLQEFESDNEDGQTTPEVDIKDDKPLFKPLEPRDKYYMAYLIYYLLGIVTLLPWNFYVTADDYWLYKFRNVSDAKVFLNGPTKRTPMQAEFTSYLSLASSFPNLIFLVVNTVISHRVSLNKRVLISLFSMQVLMLITLVFINIDTDKWQQTFFAITIISIILLNVCSAIFSGSIFGVVGNFSPPYITAVTAGQALGAIFAAVAQIIALSIGASSVHTAFVYFIIGNVTITVSIICYIILEKTVFFKYHVTNHSEVALVEPLSSINISYNLILKKIWYYGFSVFLTFLITLAVYPGVTVLIESEGKGQGHRWNDVYFVPTIAYLLCSVGDYLGRLFAVRILKPRNVTILMIFSITRFIFIPLLLLCNAQPRHHLDVVFDRDYQYIIILFLFALSNGYIANLTQIFVSKVVDHHEREIASSIMTIFMALGLTIGSGISLFMVRVL